MKKEKIRRFRHVGVMIFMIGFVQPVQLQNVFAQEISQTEQEKVDYMVFKDSSDRILNESDIWLLSQSDIRIAKNEIYARHGRKFASKDLQEYLISFLGMREQLNQKILMKAVLLRLKGQISIFSIRAFKME